MTTAVPKLTIPSPNMVHYRGGPASLDPAVYPDLEAFWADLAAAYADEVRRLGELGCTYLQFDDTSLAYLNDPAQRAEIAARGEDAEHLHLRYITQINAAVKDKPAGMAVTTHLCRGNFRSSWAASGGYDFVAEALFSELDVDGFFLEYDDERSGGFEPLRFVPPGKMVVLGLVTTKRPRAGIRRRPEAAHRGGGEVRPAGSAVPVRPVRVLLHGGGQRADLRRAGGQAPPGGQRRPRRLGLTGRPVAGPAPVRCAAGLSRRGSRGRPARPRRPRSSGARPGPERGAARTRPARKGRCCPMSTPLACSITAREFSADCSCCGQLGLLLAHHHARDEQGGQIGESQQGQLCLGRPGRLLLRQHRHHAHGILVVRDGAGQHGAHPAVDRVPG